MAWTIKITKSAEKELSKITRTDQKRIQTYIRSRIIPAENPRSLGKPLTGSLSGLHRYRVGDYRLICRIQNQELSILIVRIAHRSKVYTTIPQ